MSTLNSRQSSVKPASRTFGEGLEASKAPRRGRFIPSADDARWAAETAPGNHEHYDVLVAGPKPIRGGSPDADWDRLSDEAAFMDRYERGLV